MAGLELLYTSVAGSISSPQDAVVCCVHWEIIKSGCRCVGSGDEASITSKQPVSQTNKINSLSLDEKQHKCTKLPHYCCTFYCYSYAAFYHQKRIKLVTAQLPNYPLTVCRWST